MIIISLIGSILVIIYAIYLKAKLHEEVKRDAESFMGVVNPLMFKKTKNEEI